MAVVELPDEPDGKKLEVYFEREGQVEASTQTTRPAVTVILRLSVLHCNVIYSQTPLYIHPLNTDTSLL